MKRLTRLILVGAVSLMLPGCIRVDVQPIHIVHDVNIRVDHELDSFFAFEQSAATQPATNPATAPAPPPTTTADSTEIKS